MLQDIFNQDAFNALSLTAAINKGEFLPSQLGDVFTAIPVNTKTIVVEEIGDTLSLVQSAPRGGIPGNRAEEKRTVRSFEVPHLPLEDRLNADEIEGVRAFGSETQMELITQKLQRKAARLRRDVELTWENLRLGAIKGTILDADGSTLYNLFTEFGVSQESEVDFDLDNASPASGALRKKIAQTVRLVCKNLKGAAPGYRLRALCGEAFWDDLIAHPEVRETYLNWQAAQDLRGESAYGRLSFGGIDWEEYRGTDDGSTLVVSTDKCHIFPAGISDLFLVHYAPAATVEFVNTEGLPLYEFQAVDPKYGRYVDVAVESNPLPICTQPKCLVQGKRT